MEEAHHTGGRRGLSTLPWLEPQGPVYGEAVEIIGKQQTGLIPAIRTAAPGVQEYITGHYFGGDLDVTTEAKLYAILRNIQYGDMYSKGYSDIMYNFSPSPFRPAVIMLRGPENRNAANGSAGSNLVSMSCVLPIGPNLTYLDRIPNGRENLLASCLLVDQFIEKFFGKPLPWVGHRDVRATACPGAWFYGKILEHFDNRPAPVIPPAWMPDPDYTKRPNVGPPTGITWDGFKTDGYVHWLQNFLNRTSPEGCPVDGVWGPVTADRVRKFQGYFRAQGFQVPKYGEAGFGMVDQKTWPTIHYIATVEGIV